MIAAADMNVADGPEVLKLLRLLLRETARRIRLRKKDAIQWSYLKVKFVDDVVALCSELYRRTRTSVREADLAGTIRKLAAHEKLSSCIGLLTHQSAIMTTRNAGLLVYCQSHYPILSNLSHSRHMLNS